MPDPDTRSGSDPVATYPINSSGKMGFALAEAAAEAAHADPGGRPGQPAYSDAVRAGVNVVSAQQCWRPLPGGLPADVFYCRPPAIRADYRPCPVCPTQAEKRSTVRRRYDAEPGTQIGIFGDLASAWAPDSPALVCGVCRRTKSVESTTPRAKLQRKNLDLIIANDVSQPGIGFQ